MRRHLPGRSAQGLLRAVRGQDRNAADAPRKEGKDFRIVWPGSIYAVDSWVILEGSPNARQAEALIAFMSDAERQARPPEFISYGVTNKAAMASIPPDLLENLPSAPENLAVSVPIDVRIAGTTGVRLG